MEMTPEAKAEHDRRNKENVRRLKEDYELFKKDPQAYFAMVQEQAR